MPTSRARGLHEANSQNGLAWPQVRPMIRRILLALDSDVSTPERIELSARRAQERGYGGVSVPELAHDPFVLLALAARATDTIELASGVAIAFARSPMTLAMQAADLQRVSAGRFVLGLGSQVQAHVERRFSMPWGRPAARMRDFVLAVRAIWDGFESGRLQYRGEFYSHTLLTPAFSPGRMPFGPPPVWIAGVGERMTEVAGEVGDAYVVHPFSSEEYLREVALPALTRGAERAHRAAIADVVASPLVAVGITQSDRARAADAVRRRIAFYASTPAYRGVMELHGWGSVADQLGSLARRGAWEAMADLIDDEMLGTFAIVGDPEAAAATATARFGSIAGHLSIGLPAETSEEASERFIRHLTSNMSLAS